MSKTENILLEYQKTIPKSSRIIENISRTDFAKKQSQMYSERTLKDSQSQMFFSKTQNTKLFFAIIRQPTNMP